ncbi:MAG: creatininase family protein [Rhodospirillales bacterium]
MARDYLSLYAGLEDLPDPALAILPLGAVESHGPHLPLGTDTILAERLLDRALSDWPEAPAGLLRLPALWLGASGEHDQGRGTLSLEAEETIALIQAIGGQLARAGLRRLLLFNAHGGNVAASQIAALALRRRHGLLVAAAHWLDFGLPEALTPPSPPQADVHGGWLETSLLLHLAPDLVRRELLANSPAVAPAASLYPAGPIAWGWRAQDLAPGGWIGHPEAASAEIGAALTAQVTAGLRRLLGDLLRAAWPG